MGPKICFRSIRPCRLMADRGSFQQLQGAVHPGRLDQSDRAEGPSEDSIDHRGAGGGGGRPQHRPGQIRKRRGGLGLCCLPLCRGIAVFTRRRTVPFHHRLRAACARAGSGQGPTAADRDPAEREDSGERARRACPRLFAAARRPTHCFFVRALEDPPLSFLFSPVSIFTPCAERAVGNFPHHQARQQGAVIGSAPVLAIVIISGPEPVVLSESDREVTFHAMLCPVLLRVGQVGCVSTVHATACALVHEPLTVRTAEQRCSSRSCITRNCAFRRCRRRSCWSR